MLTLYHFSGAVCAAKVRLVLAEKALPWEGRLVNLMAGEQFSADYRKLNPNAVVPTLVHDERVLIESTVINEYLDETFADKPMRPEDAYGRARVRLWTKREDGIHDAVNTMTSALVFRHDLLQKPPEERAKRFESMPDPASRLKWRTMLEHGLEAPYVRDALNRLAKHLRDMEKTLSAGPWLAGERFTLADAGLVSFFYRFEVLAMEGVWRRRFPRVTDWYARCKARPSFATAIHDPIPQASLDHYSAVARPNQAAVESAFDAALAAF